MFLKYKASRFYVGLQVISKICVQKINYVIMDITLFEIIYELE
jgi:hypothetical protein